MCSGIDILKKYVCQSCYNVYCDMGVKLLSVKLIYVWFLDVAEPERNTKKTLINPTCLYRHHDKWNLKVGFLTI